MKLKIILGVVILALLVGLFFCFRTMKMQHDEIIDQRREISVKGDSISYLVDKNGVEIARAGVYEKSIKSLKNYNDSLERVLYYQAKMNGIKDKNILELSALYVSSHDSLHAIIDTFFCHVVSDVDTIFRPAYRADFDNGFLKAHVSLVGSDMTLSYTYSAEIFRVLHEQRPKSKFFLWRWLGISFRKKEVVVDYKSTDKNMKIGGIREIIIKK